HDKARPSSCERQAQPSSLPLSRRCCPARFLLSGSGFFFGEDVAATNPCSLASKVTEVKESRATDNAGSDDLNLVNVAGGQGEHPLHTDAVSADLTDCESPVQRALLQADHNPFEDLDPEFFLIL